MPEVVAASPQKAKSKPQGLAAAVAAGLSAAAGPATSANEYAEMLKSVPQLAALGPVFKTCAPLQVCWTGGGTAQRKPIWGLHTPLACPHLAGHASPPLRSPLPPPPPLTIYS